MTPKYPRIGLAVMLVVCFAAAGIGGAVTTPKIGTWYATPVKPSWNPPNCIFGPVWSALYFCMAIAAWLVWRQGGFSSATVPLTLFGVQPALNVLWSCLFFGLQNPGLLLRWRTSSRSRTCGERPHIRSCWPASAREGAGELPAIRPAAGGFWPGGVPLLRNPQSLPHA